MKKLLLLSLIIVSAHFAKAQAYQKMLADTVTEFDVNTLCLGVESKQEGPGTVQANCVYNYCANQWALNAWYAQGDSIYNGKTYKKFTYNSGFVGLMREDTIAKKVFFIQYCNTYEELLYDFSLNQGDTITYNFPYPGINMPSGDYIVDSIRVKHDYSTYYRKHFYLRDHSSINNYTLEMIEGVGCVVHPLFLYTGFQVGMLGYYPDCPGANFDQALSCKWDNGNKVYRDSCEYAIASMVSPGSGDSCVYCHGFTGGVNSLTDQHALEVYPNPATDKMVVKGKHELGMVFLYNAKGTLVYQTKTTNKQLELNLDKLPAGIYLLRVGEGSYRIVKE